MRPPASAPGAAGLLHTAPMSLRSRFHATLDGPPLALPAALDRCSERWWRLPPRARLLSVVALIVAALAAGVWRVDRAQERWGGPARRALVAVRDAHVGEQPDLRAVQLPPAMVPPNAPQRIDGDERLALPLPEGAVLTRTHVSPQGPAVGLPTDLRVVPIPIEEGLEIAPGGQVDVWVLHASPARSQRVAQRRPVVGVTSDDTDDQTALVGLRTDEVAAAMRGLAEGQVLLTQAPP